MIPHPLLAIACLAAAGACVLLTSHLLLREAAYRALQARTLALLSGNAPAGRAIPDAGAGRALRRLGERVMHGSRLYSKKDLDLLQDLIAVAGFNPRRTLPLVVGGKIVLMLLVPALAALYCALAAPADMTRLAILAVSVPIGMLIPEAVLRLLRRPYAAALRRGVIDALDLLVVCCEAGLGLESALERVAQDIEASNRPTAAALKGLIDELRVLPDRRDAFTNFAKRTGVEGMQRLASVLAQSLQYGTPLGQAFRTIANELRRERMVKLEERAAKLPAKLVLPLVLCILPCLIIILVGSSFLRLFDVLAIVAR